MTFLLICLIFLKKKDTLRCYCCSKNPILCTLRKCQCIHGDGPCTSQGGSSLDPGPGAVLTGPPSAELPAGLGSEQSRFLRPPGAVGGQRVRAASCGPGQGSRGEHLSVLRAWLVLTPALPVTWSSTWQPCRSSLLLVLQVGKAPAIVRWES